jgi:ECF transporter, substrate-specific component
LNIKRLVIISLFIAISAVLSNIKFFSTVALDSMPAFLAAMLISPLAGAIIGALGHLLSSFTAGFPFTIPMHLFIALQMFIIVWVFGVLFKKINQFIAILIAIILNGPIATFLSSIVIVQINESLTISGFFSLMVLPLTLVSTVNILIAFSLQKVMNRAGIKL